MEPRYVHLRPEQPAPEIATRPRRAILISDVAVGEEWLDQIAEWIVATGCLYVVAWGVHCERWHDSVDWAVLRAFDFGDVLDERFVMTTWHSDEPMSDAFWYAGHCATHPDVELGETIILHVSDEAQASEILKAYAESQVTIDEA